MQNTRGLEPSSAVLLCRCGCGEQIVDAKRNVTGFKRGHILKKHVGIGQYGSKPLSPEQIRQRLKARSKITESGCWLWQGFVDRAGYARVGFKVNASSIMAHRGAYEHFVGPIPYRMEIDHVCETPSCINPAHLEVVSPQENKMRRGAANLRWIFTNAEGGP